MSRTVSMSSSDEEFSISVYHKPRGCTTNDLQHSRWFLKQYPYCICTASCMAGKEARNGANRIGKMGLSRSVHR